jgi:hypothetical protein
VQVPVLVELKAVLESALSHFEYSILHGFKLGLELGIVFRRIAQSAQDLKCFRFTTLKN